VTPKTVRLPSPILYKLPLALKSTLSCSVGLRRFGQVMLSSVTLQHVKFVMKGGEVIKNEYAK
jgi:hypothetical protein